MNQLDFFPRTELQSMLDFQRLAAHSLSASERRQLVSHPSFFKSPSTNDVFKRQHADLIDSILGFRLRYVEEMLMAEAQGFDPEGSHETWGPSLHDGVQTWIGLNLQTLQTPYAEILRILQLIKLKPYQHVVDLGAAFGRMGVVIGGNYIKSFFTGFEYVKSRVDEGNRVYEELGFDKCKLRTQDLFAKDFLLPDADAYFIYDYGQVEHIDHTLNQIKAKARKRPLKVIVRGRFTKDIIKTLHPWLELKYEGKMDELFSIYTANLNQ